MDISDLKIDEKMPMDSMFSDLFRKLLKKEIPFYKALIQIDGIKPFSPYKPALSSAFSHNMLSEINAGKYPYLHVYQKGDVFIMSDDYRTYYSYIELDQKAIPCIVMGEEPSGKYVLEKGKADYDYSMYIHVMEKPKKS